MVRKIATIGVYGLTVDRFLAALRSARVEVLLDVRRRRGVRGPEYAWANSRRLQAALAEAGIGYRHLLELAPSAEMLAAQHAADHASGTGVRARAALSDEYIAAFTAQILEAVDLPALVPDASALFCVERDPRTCHRGLIADRLAREHSVEVTHLVP
jgi:uncharacterized protein (DUF488 family)